MEVKTQAVGLSGLEMKTRYTRIGGAGGSTRGAVDSACAAQANSPALGEGQR